MEFLNSLLYFVITIAILVFVHEFGHFIAAKLSGMRVDAFAIGFGQRLFGYNKKLGFSFGSLPKDVDLEGDTDYRVCILPLGGYVKVAGMIDESLDKDFLQHEPKPWEFRSKSTGKKLFVLSAGVLMNVLLALMIFWGINFVKPSQHLLTTTIGYVPHKSALELAGFQTGDKILFIDDKPVKYWDEILNFIFVKKIGEEINVKVERNGKVIDLQIESKLLQIDKKTGLSFLPRETKVFVADVIANSRAEAAGLKKNDTILYVNNQEIISSRQLIDIISSSPEKPLEMVIKRGNDTLKVQVTPTKDGKIGILSGIMIYAPVEFEHYNFLQAGLKAFENIGENILLFFSIIAKVITGRVEFSNAFGGPIKIAQMAAQTADINLLSFINFIALLSLSLAIINILPFPVLDGGHIIIVLLEGVLRREISPKVKIIIQNIGFIILLLFMAFVIYSDIMNFNK
ncbi:MAG: RIP metalloprotease RseP [Ignavibacteria bacterium]|jgi:regulator of sigma E protease|nr:RIP metalloprotease RseP [Ignavibacteria bacterium]MDH7528264.1 RIP metalloprotease RseP [Ignavibacteria bacterium]